MNANLGPFNQDSPGADQNNFQIDAPDNFFSDPFRPRRRTPTAQVEAENQRRRAALEQPANLDDLWLTLKQARGLDKAQAAAALRGTITRLPAETREGLGFLGEADLSSRDLAAFVKSHPDTEALVTRPEFLAVFGDRLKNIGFLGRLWGNTLGAFGGGFRRGWRNIEISRAAYQEALRTGRLNDPAFLARYQAWRAGLEEGAIEEENLDASSGRIFDLVREFNTNAGDMIGGMARAGMTPEAALAALAGAGIGAGVGATAGGVGAKSFFRQMKAALIKLYEAVAGGLGVEINDDVRKFFDSVLATEEEMAMESWRGQEVFSREEMDYFREIDPQALAEYEAAADLARQKAAEEITVARVASRERLRRQWRREGWKAAREHPSQERLSTIVTQGGISLNSLKAGGYKDADTIRALTKKRPGLVRAKANIGFDEWAGMLGFEYSDDFVQALLDSPNLKQLADEYVAEREAEYEEYEGRLDAPISDAEIELWEMQRNLWAKFMLPRDSKYAPRSARDLKRIIEEKTGLLTVDEIARQNAQDLKASLKAQVRAAREGYRAGLAEGQTAGLMSGVKEGTRAGRKEAKAETEAIWRNKLARAKTEGRFNLVGARLEALEQRLELGLKYKEQIRRQKEVFQFEAQARRIMNRKIGLPGQASGLIPAYHDQIRNLLAAAGFTGQEGPAASSLAEFVAGLEADGAPVEVAAWLLDGRAWINQETGRRRTYRSLTMPELRDLRRAVANLEHLSGRQQKIDVEGRLMDESEASRNLIGAIREHHQIREPKSHAARLGEAGRKGTVSSIVDAVSGYMSSIIKVETMARTLDGHEINGTAQRMIYQPLNRAWEQAMTYSQMFTDRLKEVVEQTVGAKALTAWRAEKVSLEGWPTTLTREQLVMAALNTGNPQNLRALKNYRLGENGETMNEAQLQAVIDSLSQEEWNFVQGVWDFLDNEMFPLLNELTLRTKGVELEKVEAAPVMTKYGEYRGGYFPLRFDRSMSERADRFHDMADRLQADQSLYARPDTQASTTIERRGTTYQNLVPHLNIGVLINSLNESIQDLTHREAVNDVWRLIRRPEVREGIEGVLGENYWIQIKRWLRETAKPEPWTY